MKKYTVGWEHLGAFVIHRLTDPDDLKTSCDTAIPDGAKRMSSKLDYPSGVKSVRCHVCYEWDDRMRERKWERSIKGPFKGLGLRWER